MKKRLWLSVPYISPRSFSRPSKPSRGKDEDRVCSFTLRLGEAINLRGYSIFYEPESPTGWFSQNYVGAHLKLRDVPARHPDYSPESDPLLEHRIDQAVYELCYTKYGDRIRSYLQGTDLAPCLLQYHPDAWPGKLEVPVDFLGITSLVGHGNSVTAHIEVGHHFIAWDQTIYKYGQFGLQSDDILDRNVTRMINEMLMPEDRQEHIRSLSRLSTSDQGITYIERVEGCDPKSLPPPITFTR